MYTYAWITTWLLSMKCVMTFGFASERFEVIIHQKVITRYSSLSCLFCFNGDASEDCMTLKNISNIPTRTCRENEPYCMVRRLTKYDNPLTFDRQCSSQCEPGCRDGAGYMECVSCCNDRSYCNVDNSAPEIFHYVSSLFIGLINILLKY